MQPTTDLAFPSRNAARGTCDRGSDPQQELVFLGLYFTFLPLFASQVLTRLSGFACILASSCVHRVSGNHLQERYGATPASQRGTMYSPSLTVYSTYETSLSTCASTHKQHFLNPTRHHTTQHPAS